MEFYRDLKRGVKDAFSSFQAILQGTGYSYTYTLHDLKCPFHPIIVWAYSKPSTAGHWEYEQRLRNTALAEEGMQGDYAARDEARGVSAASESVSEVCCTLRGSDGLMTGWCRSWEEGCRRCSESIIYQWM